MDKRTYKNGFRNLIVWQEAHKLTIRIYETTRGFPEDERFGVTSQIRRAMSSIGANLAEGSAKRTEKDRKHYYVIARGSLAEVDNFLELAHDLQYISDSVYSDLLEQVNRVGYLLQKLSTYKSV